MVFLVFGKFDCPVVKLDGSSVMMTIADAGHAFELIEENEVTLHPSTAVVIIQTSQLLSGQQ